MESIQASLKKWMKDKQSFQDVYQQMRSDIMNDPDIQQLLSEHPQLDDQAIDRQLIKLYEYQSQNKDCRNCPEGGCSNNILPGYKPRIEVDGTNIHLTYEKCKYTILREEQQERLALIKSLHMPKEILQASIADIYGDDPARYQAIVAISQFLNKVDSELPSKGLYFHGPFGVGKTYFLGAIANELADKKIASMLIYMPEFVREIKSSFKDDSVGEKIDQFKKIPVLMIDDIGAESLSAWFRDEVLGSILQYRMMEGLPTFFSSNYSLDQLEKHLSTTSRGDIEQLKAGRIIERIRQVSKPIEINGENQR
ncbi:primosomal protein DnaI [Amphibacillus sp. MSJ-3]|uniref:primosomal protein DnaI n=1 Tax=Amphibacillus sp. MSJ-3 TaxID=2841505 RepID=UPI001C0EE267|nr:primosomal protein DnaI [Amphibacillus sp. MSJ-3]MBU5593648.1 primosomal protein DnaI [Amphibacillus sp. MSJ-3]